MAGIKPWSDDELLDYREHFAYIQLDPDDQGRALVIAGDVLSDDPKWLLLLAFVVGAGRMDLIAHTVMLRPKDWDDGEPSVTHPLYVYADLVGQVPHWEGHLTTATVRSAARTELEIYVRRLLNNRRTSTGESRAASSWGNRVDPGPSTRPTGRASNHELHLALLAQRYVDLLDHTDKPNKQLAQEFSLAVTTIPSYLQQARVAGLLTRPGRGVPGGSLTDRAQQILNQGTTAEIVARRP